MKFKTNHLVTRAALCALASVWLLRGASGAEISADFRGRPYDPALFRATGPGASTAIQPDGRGLRITLPPDHGMRPAVGVVLRTGVQGDFEITMEYEILKVESPSGGNGAGVSLYITMVSYTKDAATIGRMVDKNAGPFFLSHRATTPIGGKREHHGGERISAPSSTGKLRLVRNDSTLTYLVADGATDEFQELFETELGTDDIDSVRIAADNGGSATHVDVVIPSINIKSDDTGPVELLPPRPSRWPLWVGLASGGVLLCGGWWYWQRR